MARRSLDPTAFRPDHTARVGFAPSKTQTIAMLGVLVLVGAAIAAAAVLIRPNKARAFDLFYGSIYLNDNVAPVAVDLTNGKPTVRLVDANKQVSAKSTKTLEVFPLTDGTLLLNTLTGEFNLVDSSGFVVKPTGGGVPLPKVRGKSTATALASGSSAYIVRSGTAGTQVYLVSANTVQSAIGVGAQVKPRAFGTLPAEIKTTDPGAMTTADGDLWLLTGTAGTHTLEQLSVPLNSDAGVGLRSTPHGTMSGAAAVATTTRYRDGTGGAVVGVAQQARVQLFVDGARTASVTVPGLTNVDQILPTSNQQGSLAFLYHSFAGKSLGWHLVWINTADAVTSTAVNPIAIRDIDQDHDLVAPAASNSLLYTMDKVTGALLDINDAGVASHFADYPLSISASGAVQETKTYDDTYAIARGPRVLVDSPSHSFALAIFSDGSRHPARIDKYAATSVNAAGGAVSLTAPHKTSPHPGHGKPPPPKQRPAQPVNNTIDCKATNQVPHVPTITQTTSGSRSVTVLWGYPVLDPSDCFPSTFLVKIRLLSSDAPSPPGSVRVQAQNGVTITGLFPSSRYEIIVVAYINGQGTPSVPRQISTGPEGPAAPTDIQVTTDASGNWHLSWNSCGSVLQGCVPTQSWKIIPQLCDGLPGLSSPPPSIGLQGDSTQRGFTDTYPGSSGLLGHGLSFQVQGFGTNTAGDVASSGGCFYSWGAPNGAAMSLSAGQPAQTTLGGTSPATVTLNLGQNPITNAGGIGAAVTFHLSGPAGQQDSPTQVFVGQSTMSYTFSGIAPGAQYTATATVSAPRHPSTATTVGPVPLSTSASWPSGMSISATCPVDGGLIPVTCSLAVNISGLSSADAHGERFDLSDSSRIQCSQTSQPLTEQGFDPATTTIKTSVQLLSLSGSCNVYVQLIESSSNPTPLVFAGVTSQTLPTPIDLGAPPALNAKRSDFAAGWNTVSNNSTVLVQYNGPESDAAVGQLTSAWSEQVTSPSGKACGSDNEQPTSGGINVSVSGSCVNSEGGTTGWQVTVTYRDQGSSNTTTYTYTLDGTAPTFAPCSVQQSDFTGAWSGTAANPAVTVTFGGNDSDITGCANWAYTVKDPSDQGCGSSDPAPDPTSAQPFSFNVTCSTTPSEGDWTVIIHYDDNSGNRQSLQSPVTGPPPQ